MKIDPRLRRAGRGWAEDFGYVAVAGAALARLHRGALRFRPNLSISHRVRYGGLLLSALAVRTRRRMPPSSRASARTRTAMSSGRRRLRTATSRASAKRALNNSTTDGMGSLPALLPVCARELGRIGVLTAIYRRCGRPAARDGALSTASARKWLIVFGIGSGSGIGPSCLFELRGIPAARRSSPGDAMVYPTLLAAVGDVAHPSWGARRRSACTFWRDLGYAVGALLAALPRRARSFRSDVAVAALNPSPRGHRGLRIRNPSTEEHPAVAAR